MVTGKRIPSWMAEAQRKKQKQAKRAAAKTARTGTQAQRQASRSPGGFAGGSTVSTVENYNDQVKRKYGGGKL